MRGEREERNPRTVIVGGEEMELPRRVRCSIVDDDGQEIDPDDITLAAEDERRMWLLLAMSRAWEGCDRQTLVDEVPEEYAEEAARYFDMSWAVEHDTV